MRRVTNNSHLSDPLIPPRNSAREWKVESITARCGLNTLQATFKSNRKKLASVREELKDLRRSQSARTVRRLERDNAQLSAIPKSSEIDPVTDSTTALRKEIFRLKGVVSRQAETIAELETANKRLCSTNATHSKARFGTRSEKNGKGKRGSTGKSVSTVNRGQQTGKPGHGRSPRPHLECKTETRNPPDKDRLCPCCGAPYVQNGSHESKFIEIKVKSKRVNGEAATNRKMSGRQTGRSRKDHTRNHSKSKSMDVAVYPLTAENKGFAKNLKQGHHAFTERLQI